VSDRNNILLSLALRTETDIGYARRRSREIAELLSLSPQKQTQLATAVSELTRNALLYGGGGDVEFTLHWNGRPEYVVLIRDSGPGIDKLDEIMTRSYHSPSGFGLGLRSARKLVDRFAIDTSADGTTVKLTMFLSPEFSPLDDAAIAEVKAALADNDESDPVRELQRQNHELLHALEQVRIAQEETNRAHNERDALLALVPSIVLHASEDGLVDYLNSRWTQYTGMDIASSRGRGWKVAIHPEDRQGAVAEWRQALTAGRSVEIELRLRRADGAYRWHMFRAEPLFSDFGRVWYGSMSDIHDARERASEAARFAEYRERILGVVSHDLRSPLSAILVATELLRVRGLDDATEGIIGRVDSCANRALRMISTLLDYTSSHLGRGIPIDPTIHNVATLVRDSVNEYRLRHPERELLLDVPEATVSAWLDGDRVAQAIDNLLRNAFTHGSTEHSIRVAVSSTTEAVMVEIGNRGEVIPPETLTRIFEPFQRAAKRKTGFGLGLYIVREIARAHGGTAELISTEADGTVARLTLPRHPPSTT